jgi:PAS domain S-box-containing protein
MYRQVFDVLPDAVLVVDAETENILESNEAAKSLYGYSKEEFSQNKCSGLAAEPENTPAVAPYALTGAVVQYHKKKSGAIFPVTLSVIPFTHENKRLHIVVVRALTDCSEKKTALQKKGDRFQLFFERSDNAALLLDGETFVDCNENALRLIHGSHREQLINLRPQDISPERQPDGSLSSLKAQTLIKTALCKGSNRFEWVHSTFDNKEIWTEVSLTAVPAPERQIMHVAWRDSEHTKEPKRNSKNRRNVTG